MAQSILEGTKLRLMFEVGLDDLGKTIYKSKTFSNVRKEVTGDQLFQASMAISALCNDPLNTVERSDNTIVTA
jgi:hypothetical protein